MYAILIIATLSRCFAGHAPYLGQDLSEIAEQTKLPTVVPQKVSEKQLAEYQTYHSKFFDIANAYAQGYQAAMRDIQTRSVIPRPNGMLPNPATFQQTRSMIPAAPVKVAKVPRSTLVGHLVGPTPNDIAVRVSEKLTNARSDLGQHNMVERSAPAMPSGALSDFLSWQHAKNTLLHDVSKDTRSAIMADSAATGAEKSEGIPMSVDELKKRSEIARLNQAARHRNVYFDAMGGDPYTGASGVLTRQNIWLKHRRSAESNEGIRRLSYKGLEKATREELKRRRRSRMPYLGQNLDKIGVVRAKPNWETGDKKTNVLSLETFPAAVSQYQYQLASQVPQAMSHVPGTARSDVPMMQTFQAWAQLMQQQGMPSAQPVQVRAELPTQGYYPAQQYSQFNPYFNPQYVAGKPEAFVN